MASIVLGVSGSIAAYRACDLARDLMRAGHTVRVCLTDAAQEFVRPALFEGLTGQPCLVNAFEEPERGRMAHIDWARQADLLVIAPATANTINKLAQGVGEDMLTTIGLAFQGPVVVCPAMNPTMYAQPSVQESLNILRGRGGFVLEPTEGEVACGEQGQGKLASNTEIVAFVQSLLGIGRALKGKRVLITSGPTQEPIDVARYLTNRSSGRMGAALAQAAQLMGASVTVISGPTSVPVAGQVVRVRTAQQMLDAALPLAHEADLIIGAAAVADYRPEAPSTGKIRRSSDPIELRLVPNPDVIAALAAAAKPGALVVGFAAEPSLDPAVAQGKMARKGLHAIAANDVSQGDQGFEAQTNRLMLFRAGQEPLDSGLLSKFECAVWLLRQLT